MDYYSANYRDYELQNPSKKLDFYISQIEKSCSVSTPTILDVGFGLGAFLKRVAEVKGDWNLFGTELRTEAVDQVSAQLSERATIRQASADETNFSNQRFDVITAWDVLEHLDDPIAAIAHLRSLLSEEGTFHFVVPVYDGVLGPVVKALDKDPTHVHQESRDFWIASANDLFREVEWQGILRYLLPGGAYVHWPNRAFRSHSPAIIVTCSK